MKTCPYCGLAVKFLEEDIAFCGFCSLEMSSEYLNINGSRRKMDPDPYISLDKISEMSTSELFTVSAYELVIMLYLLRRERRERYELLKTANKVLELDRDTFESMAAETADNYEFWTRKKFVIENVLIEKIGYVPKRITDAFLREWKEKIITSNKSLKPMAIRKKEGESTL